MNIRKATSLRTVLVAAAAAAAAVTVMSVVQAQPSSAVSTAQVQWDLAGMGYLALSDVGGASDAQTTAAVKAFQTDRCLAVDGVVGTETSEELSAQVTQIQEIAGSGLDGEYGPNTEASVKTWQGAHGLPQTGQVDAATETAMNMVRVRDCGTPTAGELGSRIVQLATQEAADSQHNREIGGYNCNYYTTALGLAGTGDSCSNGWKTQAWCADFGKWVWMQSGVDSTGVNSVYDSFETYGKNEGTWHTGGPQPGDAIVFDFGHVGLVVSATSSDVTYISGNTSNPADGQDDAVLKKTVSISYSSIVGYATPVAR
jgi:peptidoglycan hydrolase-like protein with peptidoglycan-binding domain